MRKQIQIASLVDFTGGLNLRADAFKLAPNEVPDCMNVDVDPRGGFKQRRAVAQFNGTALAATPSLLAQFSTSGGVKQIVAAATTTLQYSTGGNFTSLGVVQTSTARPTRVAVMNDRCYFQNGTDGVVRWDGTTATRLGTAFNGTGVPTGGNAPVARCVASHLGYLFVANTLEASTRYPSRVRFSYAGQPEDFYSDDFFEVDLGRDGDEITALVPHGDRMYIFKRNSVYMLVGYDSDSFQIIPLSHKVGAVSQEATAVTDYGVYCFSWPDGVFLLNGGNEPRWVFERLHPAITGGGIPDSYQDKITLGWGNRRLWVSVPYAASTTAARTYVLDPTLGKVGSWVQYDFGLGPLVEWRPAGSEATFLGASPTLGRVFKLDQDIAFDDFGSGATHIVSYLRTRWVDLGQPASMKRWRAPEVVVKSLSTASYTAQALLDYDPTRTSGSFTITTSPDVTTALWGTAVWGTDVWAAAENEERVTVVKGSPLGTGRAVALRFDGPVTNTSWGVDAIAFKYTLKPIR